MSKKYVVFIIEFFTVLVLILFDQFTKNWAITNLKSSLDITLIPNVFRLKYLENHGAAFGILEGEQFFFYLITPIILLIVIYILFKLPLQKKFIPMRLSGLFLVAGAVGNFIDRLSYKYVVDFLYFELIDFPIFNVADIYVCLATASYMLLILFYYNDEDYEYLSFKRK